MDPEVKVVVIGLVLVYGLATLAAAFWYFHTRLQNSVTVPFTKLTRAILYDTRSEERIVLGPGTHSLAPRIKLLTRIDTNTHLVPEPGGESASLMELVRAEQVEFDVKYAYQVRYRRTPSPQELAAAANVDAAEQEALSRHVLIAYERYDEEEERRAAIQQAMSQVLEEVVRAFSPNQLAEPKTYPCTAYFRRDPVDGMIAEILSVTDGDVTAAAPIGLEAILIVSSHDLLPFLGQAIRDIVDRQAAAFGMEVVRVFVQDLPYHDESLQRQAERVFEAQRIQVAAQRLIDDGHCTTPQEAMTVALGQDARYADIVIQQGWQRTVAEVAARLTGAGGGIQTALAPLAQAASVLLQNQGGGGGQGARGRRP